jgi:CheY-like chemotaxis protein
MAVPSQPVMNIGHARGTGIAVGDGGLMLDNAPTQIRLDQASAATIFVIEDDPHVSGTLAKVLRARGYRVLVASTGADARALFDEVQPDLIILDLMLPDADGLFLTASFRTLTSAPIVICSARQGQIDRVLGLKLGAADFVTKPFELEDFEARVEAVLRQSRLPAEPPRRDEIVGWPRGHPGRPRLRRVPRSTCPSDSE